MKVAISNLGNIQKAEIELSPFTVFIGRSGTGKSWTAYTIASIVSNYGFKSYLQIYEDKIKREQYNLEYDVLEESIQEFLESGSCQINLVNFAQKFAEKYVNDLAKMSPNWLSKFLGTSRLNFNNLEVKFSINELKQDLVTRIRQISFQQEMNYGNQGLKVFKQQDEEEIYFYQVYEGNRDSLKDSLKLPPLLIRDLFLKTILGIIHECFYADVHIFPTERTAYIGFPFSVNLSKLMELEMEKTISPEEQKPIMENLMKFKRSKRSRSGIIDSLTSVIASAVIKTDQERDEEAEKDPQIKKYIDLANFLQENILSGHVKFNSSPLVNEIIFEPIPDVKLEMHLTSSMIKELTPLYLCLRYLAKPNELLVIDEPEMNLHPAAQVEITEFLAMLVNAGIKVLITTHSPYIVNHISNLIKAANYENKDTIKEKFYLERTDAFIAQKNVSIYLFEDGTAKNILHENGQIDWDTFADVSDDVGHILF